MRTLGARLIGTTVLVLFIIGAAGAAFYRHWAAAPLDPRKIAGCYVLSFADPQTRDIIPTLFSPAPESLALDTDVVLKNLPSSRKGDTLRRLAPLHTPVDSLLAAAVREDSAWPWRFWSIAPKRGVELHVSWGLRGSSLSLRPSGDGLRGIAMQWTDVCSLDQPPSYSRFRPEPHWEVFCPTYPVKLTRIACPAPRSSHDARTAASPSN